MRARLPKTFFGYSANDLIRLGRDGDGGYLVSKSDVYSSKFLITFGVGDDWSFEEDFISINDVPIFAYDASVNNAYFFKKFILSIFKISRPRIAIHWLKTIISYNRFFSKKNVRHIQKFVGIDTLDGVYCTFEEVVKDLYVEEKIFVKIDIEGSEYRLLDELVQYQDKLSGLVIEFHDLDLHLNTVESFIQNFDLSLVHVHANNGSPIRKKDSLPLVIELTFSQSRQHFEEFILPHRLDQANDKNLPEIELIFE